MFYGLINHGENLQVVKNRLDNPFRPKFTTGFFYEYD